jgi:outer membrane protein OmpA-like peptidoglycan-associated protein
MSNGEGYNQYSDAGYRPEGGEQAPDAGQAESTGYDSSSERSDLSEGESTSEQSSSEQTESSEQTTESGQEQSTDAAGYSEREDLSGGKSYADADTVYHADAQSEVPTAGQAQSSEAADAAERPDLSAPKSYADADTVYHPDAAESGIEPNRQEKSESSGASERPDISEPKSSADQDTVYHPDAPDPSIPPESRQTDAAFKAEPQTRDAASEAAERQKVSHPEDGVGFRFGDKNPAKGEMECWYKSLPENLHKALQDKESTVRISARASRPGSDSFNQQLSDQRAESVKQWLKDKGVKAKIEAKGVGEYTAQIEDRPDNQDYAMDRTARIVIEPADRGTSSVKVESAPQQRAPERPPADKAPPIGDLAKEPPLPHEYDHEKAVRDFFTKMPPKDIVGIHKRILTDTLSLFKSYLEGVAETAAANSAEAQRVGVFYSLNVFGRDARTGAGPHIQEGKLYDAREVERLTNQRYGDRMHHDPRIGVMNSDRIADMRRGIERTTQAVNRIVREARTPDERRKTLDAFVTSVQQKILETRARRTEERKKRRR